MAAIGKRKEDIFQAATAIAPEDSAETIAAKVLALEHKYFAGVIEGLIAN
jgi:folate-dependent phosphoribosylglycinamide formyltransferase PurN